MIPLSWVSKKIFKDLRAISQLFLRINTRFIIVTVMVFLYFGAMLIFKCSYRISAMSAAMLRSFCFAYMYVIFFINTCFECRCLPNVDDRDMRTDTNVLSLWYVQSQSKVDEASRILQAHDTGRLHKVRHSSLRSSIVKLCSCKFHRNHKE